MNGKKILLVDDDPVFVSAMSSMLQAEGYDVVTAEDGAAAISAVHQGKPDLILLDILFAPDVSHGGGVSWDGFLILDWLRRIAPLADTPVILVTAADPAPYAERARKLGVAGLFQKPVKPTVCMNLIHRLLDQAAVVTQ